ncbi:hypothetical protein CRG98_040771, partial [Punica granatum]
ESLNASYLSPYLESLGSNFANGANFAIGGAATLPRFKPFSLDLQVLQFLRFRERSLLLSSEGYANQVREDFKNALYIIDIGQNDLSAAFTYLSYEQVIQNITTFVTEIKSAVWEFNGQLRALCEELQSEMTDATIVYIDVYSAKYDLIANAANYGFEKPLMVCCGYGGPPYNFNPDFLCGNSRSTACDPGQRYVSWDGVHYTEAANSILAANILSSNFSTPQINLNFFCNV